MRRILYFGLLLPLSKLPLCVLSGVKPFLFILLYHGIRYRKSTVMENIDKSFPEKSTEEKNRIRTKFYWHLSTLIIESVKNMGFSAKQLEQRIQFVNAEKVHAYLDQRRNVVIVGGHFGNWEWVITSLGGEFTKNLFGLGMPMTDRFWDHKLTAKRERFGLKVIHSKNHKEFLSNPSNHPFVILMLSDQSPGDSHKSFWMNFLNQTTAVQFGSENMANQSDAVVFYYHMNRVKNGRYEVVFELVTDTPKTEDYGFITSTHTALLEKDIRLNPSQWMWSHKRWKREIPPNLDVLFEAQKIKFNKKYR